MAKKAPKKKRYYKPNKEYAERTRSQMAQGEWWTPDKKKKNQIRVLPAWDERGICYVRRVLHFGFEEGGRKRAFPCLQDNQPWLEESPCPTCHVIKRMAKGDKDEREAAGELRASSPKFIVQIIDCNDIEAGVQLWSAPLSFGKYFLSLLEDEDIEDITDPEDGYDIYFDVSGTGRGTRYDYRLRAKATPIPYDDWEDELQDLIELIDVRDCDEMIELLKDNYGNAFDIDEYLEDFEGETSKKKSKKKKQEKDEEEEEEEERPSRKKSKGKKKRRVEEEEEEEEEEVEYTVDDINDMNKRKLLKLVRDQDLPIDDDDWDSVKELRELIIEELDLEEEEED